eukprot:scaffold105465_cov56-Phaeocystis_antarctica.AAC.2
MLHPLTVHRVLARREPGAAVRPAALSPSAGDRGAPHAGRRGACGRAAGEQAPGLVPREQ